MNPASSGALDVAVIDLETGGLRPEDDPILQMAVVTAHIDSGGITIENEWSTMVRLRRPWSTFGAQHIHGIRRHRLLLAPSLTTAMQRLSHICANRTIVAHNLQFDWSFIVAASRATGVPAPTGPHLCTLQMSRATDPNREQSHRLTDVAERFGIVNEHAHDALFDARTAALILPRLLAVAPHQR